MPAVVGMAYLRVFEPLEALPERERNRWEPYLVQERNRPAVPAVYRQRSAGAGGGLGLLTVEGEHADVRFAQGHWYVCPWRTRLRVLAGLLSLKETVPAEVAEVLVPEAEARRAAREIAGIRKRDPRAVPAILQSAWHIPVRWFVLFEDGERRLEERPGGGYRLSYWTDARSARDRAQRAAGILERHDLGPVGAIVRDLDEWLSCFAEGSAVELDYADVTDPEDWNALDDDRSVLEIQKAVEALDAGDLEGAGELYQGVAGRWAQARQRESLN
ncbi:MAG: hypothetical protein ACRDH8_04125 [Actinomycetota bacterium]